MSIHILGDKTAFLSKNAVIRLKADIKEKKEIDNKKYLKAEFGLKIEIVGEDSHVHVIPAIDLEAIKKKEEETRQKEEAEKKRSELHKKFKQSMNDSRKERGGEMKKKMESLKRSVPTKIFDSYARLLSKYKLANIPAPDEVINNVDKYKIQISAVMGKIGKISDDARASNDIRHYFTTLGEFLGIEPMNIDMLKQMESQMSVSNSQPNTTDVKNDDTDDEDEVEELICN